MISKLKKPENGFEEIELTFKKLDEKLSETVVDQFLRHVRYLKRLAIFGEDSSSCEEADKLNILELATKIIEEQEEPMIKKLSLSRISSNSVEEPSE